MKKALLTAATLFCLIGISFAQDLPGFRTSNYNGVMGVYSNPANIAKNNYKWDINILSLSGVIGNNNASVGFKDFANLDTVFNRFFSDPNKPSTAFINSDNKIFSLMLGLDNKSSIAVSARARVMLNTSDIDAGLGKQIIETGEDNISFPYNIKSNDDMRATANAWTEFGFSYGRVLMEKGKHFIKGGLTAKYLAGVGNAFVNIDKLDARLDQGATPDDVILTKATGGLEIGIAGVDLDNLKASDLFAFKSSGIGADLGLIYEYRPKADATENKSDQYKFRVGLSLTDLGRIKYKKDLASSGGYRMNIPNQDAPLHLNELEDLSAEERKEYLDNHFTPVNSGGNRYNVSLPTMFNLDLDYRIMGGLYVNGAANVSLVNNDRDKAFNSYVYNTYTFTPRIETKTYGVYIPLSYNELSNFNAGLAAKIGPVFFGSSSIISALGKTKQIDAFFGFRFGVLAKK